MAMAPMTGPTNMTSDAATALELGLPQAMALAIRLHRAGNLGDACTLYERILSVAPSHAGALHAGQPAAAGFGIRPGDGGGPRAGTGA